MDPKLQFICFAISLVFLALATFVVPEHPRFRFIAAGLTVFVFVFMVNAAYAI